MRDPALTDYSFPQLAEQVVLREKKHLNAQRESGFGSLPNEGEYQ
jgi:hypothetical protein